MKLGVDSSQPPDQITLRSLATLNVSIVAGYIGGATPHVWTRDEWLNVRDSGLTPQAIYVAPNDHSGHADGTEHGNRALDGMHTAGLSSLVWLDLEANFVLDQEWIQGFYDAVSAGQADVGHYGTVSTLALASDARFVSWLALYGPYGNIALPLDAVGWQYQAGARFDWSVWDEGAPTSAFAR